MKEDALKWKVIRALYAISVPVASIPHLFLNNYRGNEHIPYSFIDGAIPLIPVFVVPYLFWFAFVAAILIVMAFADDDNYYQLLARVWILASWLFVMAAYISMITKGLGSLNKKRFATNTF